MSSKTAKTPSRKGHQPKVGKRFGKLTILSAKDKLGQRRFPLLQELVNAVSGKAGEAAHEIVVGEVTLRATFPSEDVVRANVAKAQQRLAVALADFAHPGIQQKKQKDVAYFRADPGNPHLLIQELNGNTTRGVIEHGKFVEVP